MRNRLPDGGLDVTTVALFCDPDLEWDSGHKYGLVCPGVGWVVWRDSSALPDDLVFNVNYLGGSMPTFALNFSRPARRSSPSTTTSCARATTHGAAHPPTPRAPPTPGG